MKIIKKDIVHVSFEIGLLIKGIDGILEIAGGFLLLYLNPNRMVRLIAVLTQHELSEDPKDLVANAGIRGLLSDLPRGHQVCVDRIAVAEKALGLSADDCFAHFVYRLSDLPLHRSCVRVTPAADCFRYSDDPAHFS